MIDNDTRGWIMTALSGIACITGSCIVFIDLLIRLIPNKHCRNFRIQHSNAFLSCSLSLSFGVMLFSSTKNLLSSAEKTLTKGGFTSKQVAWIWLGCFFAGAIVIQVLARIAHHYLPHQVVDCDHTHEEDEEEAGQPYHNHTQADPRHDLKAHADGSACERRSIHSHSHRSVQDHLEASRQSSSAPAMEISSTPEMLESGVLQRPSLHTALSQKVTKLISSKERLCCEQGQCYGYSDPCGVSCFKNMESRTTYPTVRHPLLHRSVTTPQSARTASLPGVDETSPLLVERGRSLSESEETAANPANGHSTTSSIRSKRSASSRSAHSLSQSHHDHHHHVPENAFLSIGLQTTLAIALHKLPEGFITFATNHANPKLGFTVFLALFIHNITEGFTMALPLFLALRSRWKAVAWSSALGGLSQPLGAGIAALWFKFAGSGDAEPGDVVYGCMYAIIAGIMASVALQLFAESLDLTHNRGLCLIFAFVGMGILGISNALTA